MAQLAIEGHKTRGEEVIEILGILGGSNAFGHIGNNPRAIYYIDETYKNFITCSETKKVHDGIIFTIEEFLEKFPYKVGDKVLYKRYKTPYFIRKMFWEKDKVLYEVSDEVYSDGSSLPDTLIFDVDVAQLRPYKEETTKDNLVTEEDFNNTPEVEQEYMKLAENLLNQLIESTHWKCNEFDSQKMLAMFLKKKYTWGC